MIDGVAPRLPCLRAYSAMTYTRVMSNTQASLERAARALAVPMERQLQLNRHIGFLEGILARGMNTTAARIVVQNLLDRARAELNGQPIPPLIDVPF